MNNFEKFRDNLQELIDQKINIAVNKETGEPCNCNGLNCLKCAIYSPCRSCKNAMVEWLLSEYKEPPVDWSKVPVDAPLLVRMDENCDWERQIKSEAVREFIHKFERRTQLRQMSKSECISTMYDIWHESGASEKKDIQED